ncbi:hypothetical protein L208DRAFT_121728 [Tricholoma matsutake]|nr:hypothetical protein L208DRAFT_121728 [Tricholoma matsutake 945]
MMMVRNEDIRLDALMVVDDINLHLGICVATAMIAGWTSLIVQLLSATFAMCLNHHLLTMRGHLYRSDVQRLLTRCVSPKYRRPRVDIPKPVTTMKHSREPFYLQQLSFNVTLAQYRHFLIVRWNTRY